MKVAIKNSSKQENRYLLILSSVEHGVIPIYTFDGLSQAEKYAQEWAQELGKQDSFRIMEIGHNPSIKTLPPFVREVVLTRDEFIKFNYNKWIDEENTDHGAKIDKHKQYLKKLLGELYDTRKLGNVSQEDKIATEVNAEIDKILSMIPSDKP